MRLWLMIPIALPGAWATITWADMWPAAYALELGRPEVGLGLTLLGIFTSWMIERAIGRGTAKRDARALKREARKAAKVARVSTDKAAAPEAAERLIAWDGTPMPMFNDRMRQLRVEMPEPRLARTLSTATPAPFR